MTQVMLYVRNLHTHFYIEAYITNRVLIRPNIKKMAYELWSRNKPGVKYLISIKYILRDVENLGKADAKSHLGIFLGHSLKHKTYMLDMLDFWKVLEKKNNQKNDFIMYDGKYERKSNIIKFV